MPELATNQTFVPNPAKAVGELAESAALGLVTRPVVLGLISFLMLATAADRGPLAHLSGVVPAYQEILAAMAGAGALSVQVDEPVLGLDLPHRR